MKYWQCIILAAFLSGIAACSGGALTPPLATSSPSPYAAPDLPSPLPSASFSPPASASAAVVFFRSLTNEVCIGEEVRIEVSGTGGTDVDVYVYPYKADPRTPGSDAAQAYKVGRAHISEAGKEEFAFTLHPTLGKNALGAELVMQADTDYGVSVFTVPNSTGQSGLAFHTCSTK